MGRRSVTTLVVAVALLAVGCSDPAPPDYGPEYRAEFMEACRRGVDASRSEATCGCWYDRIEADTPFDELPALDDLTSADPPSADPVTTEVDPALYERLADCVLEVGGAATATPGSVPLPTLPPTTLPPTTLEPAVPE